MPSVSVIIPTFNSEETIRRALDSVVAQTRPVNEVIICDDHSTDLTLEICSEYNNRLPLKILYSKKQTGASAARNRGLKKATSEYIAFLDSDDEWLPKKTEIQLQRLTENPDIVLIGCYASLYNKTGIYKHPIHPNKKPHRGINAWKKLLAYNYLATPCVIAKRKTMIEVHYFDEKLPIAEDQDLWFKLARKGYVDFIEDTFVKVYAYDNSLSQRHLHNERQFLLGTILKHIEINKIDLSLYEKRKILRTRYEEIARSLFQRNHYVEALNLFSIAIKNRASLLGILYFMISSSFIGEFFKKFLNYNQSSFRHFYNPISLDLQSPSLLVLIDTEEEFDWDQGFSKDNRSTNAIKNLPLLQKIFDRYNVIPIYAIDYPIAEDPKAVKLLKRWQKEGKCEIGAQLHPWVCPPYEEETNTFNSYPGNLPYDLEYQKLKNLRDLIIKNFGCHPKYYKAGRYGYGKNTTKILKDLGFEIDLSFVPHTDFSKTGGTNFLDVYNNIHWLDEEKTLIELPMTKNFTGLFAKFGKFIRPILEKKYIKFLRLTGIFAKLNLLNLPLLTPEGIKLTECISLTKELLKHNNKLFHYTLHSSSLLPGGSPYVKTEEELEAFLKEISDYLAFFHAIGGKTIKGKDIKTLIAKKF